MTVFVVCVRFVMDGDESHCNAGTCVSQALRTVIVVSGGGDGVGEDMEKWRHSQLLWRRPLLRDPALRWVGLRHSLRRPASYISRFWRVSSPPVPPNLLGSVGTELEEWPEDPGWRRITMAVAPGGGGNTAMVAADHNGGGGNTAMVAAERNGGGPWWWRQHGHCRARRRRSPAD